MKKTDIAMIVFIAVTGVLISFFAAKAVLGNDTSELQSVKTIDRIESTVTQPDERIFNENAINPSVEISIDGEVDNSDAQDSQSAQDAQGESSGRD